MNKFHDLVVNFTSNIHNKCIKHAQMLCNFTPNRRSYRKIVFEFIRYISPYWHNLIPISNFP